MTPSYTGGMGPDDFNGEGTVNTLVAIIVALMIAFIIGAFLS